MVGPAGDRAETVQLVKVHRSLHDVAPRNAKCSLQIERAEDLPVLDRRGNIGRVSSKLLDASIGEGLLHVVPLQAFGQLIRSVLHEHGQDVFPRGGNRLVDTCRHRDFKNRLLARPTVFRIVVSSLDVIQRRTDVHRAVMLWTNTMTGAGGELRWLQIT